MAASVKVLFSNPPWWIEQPEAIYAPKLLSGVRAGSRWPFTTAVRSRPDHYHFGDYLPYPFFLGSAATYLARATGAAVTFRDSLALRDSYRTYFRLLREQAFDYLVIESASPSWSHDARLITRIKRECPETKIILTGPIAVRGEALLADHPLHAVIQGEYEKGCVRVIEGAGGLLPHDLLSEAELNAAPFPYMDDRHALCYWDRNPKGQQPPQAQVLSSRGCPFRCIFCVWPAVMTGNDPDGRGSRPVRQYTADHMEGLLRDWIGRYGYRCVYFDDDTFNLGDRHVLGLCDVMERLHVPWSAMCRADTIAPDTWRRMHEAGCFGVKLGFESGNQWVEDNIVHKNLDLAKAREVVLHLKALGFTLHGTFTVGLPGETAAQQADTRRYRESLPLDSFQESGVAAIEGSPLANLGRTGHLDRYPGADPAGNYIEERDGTTKRVRLACQGLGLEAAIRHWRAGKPALAEAICHHVLREEGPSGPALELLATLAVQAEQPELGARFLGRAIAADPTRAAPFVHLGNLLRSLDLTEAASPCYQQGLALAPDTAGAHIGLDLLAHGPAHNASLHSRRHQAGVRRELAAIVALVPGLANALTPPAATISHHEAAKPHLIVLDHGMRSVAGHHLAYNTGLLIECLKRDLPVEFYVHTTCHPDVVAALHAKAVLRPARNTIHSDDPQCGFLEEFLISSRLAEYNARELFPNGFPATDILFIHTADPKILAGLAVWYKSLPAARQPNLCLKFQNHGYQHIIPQQRMLAESMYRLALRPFIGMPRVHMAASNSRIAKQIEAVAQKPCPVFPIPLQIDAPGQSHAGSDIVIGYCGEGRPEQGVELLPDIIETTLAAHPDVRFVIQLGCNYATQETKKRFHALGDRVTLYDHCAMGQHFYDILQSFDVLLLPYAPDRYIDRSSQLVIEAISLGVPCIIPDRTSLAVEAQTYGSGAVLFSKQTLGAIQTAIEHFLTDRETLSRQSFHASTACRRFHNAETLLDMLLAACRPDLAPARHDQLDAAALASPGDRP